MATIIKVYCVLNYWTEWKILEEIKVKANEVYKQSWEKPVKRRWSIVCWKHFSVIITLFQSTSILFIFPFTTGFTFLLCIFCAHSVCIIFTDNLLTLYAFRILLSQSEGKLLFNAKIACSPASETSLI